MDQLLTFVRGYSFGKMTYPNGGVFGPIKRPYLSILHVFEGACTLQTPETSVTVQAGATNSKFSFSYQKGRSTTATWCEGFLPEMREQDFRALNRHYEPISTSSRLKKLHEIGISTGHGSSSSLNAMRDTIGLAVVKTFLHESQKSGEDLRLPKAILHARRIITNRLGDEALSISSIADEVGITQQYLITAFKKHLGITPARYLWRLRLLRARIHLVHSRTSQAEIAFKCGFKSVPHFSRSIKKQFGMTPSELRRDVGFTQPSDLDDGVLDIHF
jgi:AraC-like DNA-binding protein